MDESEHHQNYGDAENTRLKRCKLLINLYNNIILYLLIYFKILE
jgi:hypothetical protein